MDRLQVDRFGLNRLCLVDFFQQLALSQYLQVDEVVIWLEVIHDVSIIIIGNFSKVLEVGGQQLVHVAIRSDCAIRFLDDPD